MRAHCATLFPKIGPARARGHCPAPESGERLSLGSSGLGLGALRRLRDSWTLWEGRVDLSGDRHLDPVKLGSGQSELSQGRGPASGSPSSLLVIHPRAASECLWGLW